MGSTRNRAVLLSLVVVACNFDSEGLGDGASSASGSASSGSTEGSSATSSDAATTVDTNEVTTQGVTSASTTAGSESTTESTSGGSASTGAVATTGSCQNPTTWYLDGDGDGYGDPASAVEACDPPTGDHVAQGGDCDDDEQPINPGANELCDDIDNDCDGGIDEGSPSNLACDGCTFFASADGDHYFAYCPGPLTYTEARQACNVYGPMGELAVVDNATDDAALAALVTSVDAFLGIDDLVTEGTWLWDDGTTALMNGNPVGYDGWANGEPNGGTNENCAEYDPAIDGWNDGICDLAQPFFCRHPA